MACCCLHVVFALIHISPQSGNFIALANVLQKASGPLLFLGRLAAAGEMSLLWTLSVPPLGSVILGGGGELQAEVGLGPPTPYVKCPEKASLSATSYPIQPRKLPSEQHEGQRASEGTHNLAADKGLVHQSINHQVHSCSPGY